jgi:hypothetical protein
VTGNEQHAERKRSKRHAAKGFQRGIHGGR